MLPGTRLPGPGGQRRPQRGAQVGGHQPAAPAAGAGRRPGRRALALPDAGARGGRRQVARLAESVGFRYKYDEKSRQFAHAAVALVLTPEGKISRYLYGVDFKPRDLRFALVEASGGRVGTTLDRVLLTCFKYDPMTQGYTPYAFGFVRIGALLSFAALVALLAVLWRREWRMPPQEAGMNEWVQGLNELMRRLLVLPEQASTFADPHRSPALLRLHRHDGLVGGGGPGVGLLLLPLPGAGRRTPPPPRWSPACGSRPSSSPSRCSSSWSGCTSASGTTSGTRTPPRGRWTSTSRARNGCGTSPIPTAPTPTPPSPCRPAARCGC